MLDLLLLALLPQTVSLEMMLKWKTTSKKNPSHMLLFLSLEILKATRSWERDLLQARMELYRTQL